MIFKNLKFSETALLALLLCSGGEASQTSKSELRAFPETMLWAWEREENLEFIDPEKVGVAFLAKTLLLTGTQIRQRPRLNPLKVSPNTKLMAVVRIETDVERKPPLSRVQMRECTKAIVDVIHFPQVKGIQIDFDATRSQRDFYNELLGEIRKEMPPSLSLSITALASWCLGDPWIKNIDVDEAVPMLFRMGPEAEDIRRLLSKGPDFSVDTCQGSYGFSTDEPLVSMRPARRIYIFSPTPWTKINFEKIMEELR